MKENELSDGIRKHIRTLKNELRQDITDEGRARLIVGEILDIYGKNGLLDGWPDKYNPVRSLIDAYSAENYAITHTQKFEELKKRREKVDSYSDEDKKMAHDVLPIIFRLYRRKD